MAKSFAELKVLAAKARLGAVIGTYHAKSGHPGGSLSAADIFTYLYFNEMNVNPEKPDWEDRDRFVLSKGHCCPSLYAVLAMKGYFDWKELESLRHVGAMLQGHPDMKSTPGVTTRTTAFTPCSATANVRKVRSGRRLCSPLTTSSTTS